MTPLTDLPRNKDGSLSRTALKKLSKSGLLRGIDLAGADLGGQNLADLYLTDANLSGAELTGANLTRAWLNGANLIGANLTGANLTDAHLSYAKLNGTNLTDANLIGATLTGTDLTGATLTGATLTGANLDDVVGLDISHGGIAARGAVCCTSAHPRSPVCWGPLATSDGHDSEVQDLISAFGRQENAGSYADSLLTVLAILTPSR